MSTVVRPGTQFVRQAVPPAGTLPTNISTAFMVGFAERGPHDAPRLVTSIDEFEAVFGGRGGVYQLLHDSVETFFAHPHSAACWIGRVVGPSAAAATVTIKDGSNDDALTVTALEVGAWANGATGGIDVVIASGSDSGKKVTITLDDVPVEEWDNLADVAAIVAALEGSAYVRGVDEENEAPTNGTYPLAAGTDDNSSATNDSWAAALDLFARELGPGQVLAPGRTTATAHGQLLDHAADNNRSAVLDLAADDDDGDAITARQAVMDHINAERGALFGPWPNVRQAVAGVDRSVPASALTAAQIAVGDEQAPARWPFYDSAFAVGLAVEFTEAERGTLTDNHVNTFRVNPATGRVQLYGFRGVSSDPSWADFAHQRLFMQIEAEALALAEQFVGQPITLETIHAYGAAIESEILAPLFRDGRLYGRSPDGTTNEARYAYSVDVGSVNTAETIADRQLNASIRVRASEHVEFARVVATKVPSTQTV